MVLDAVINYGEVNVCLQLDRSIANDADFLSNTK